MQKYDRILVRDGKAICPFCGKKPICQVRPDTVMRNVPHKCKLCHQEYLVNIEAPVPASKVTSA